MRLPCIALTVSLFALPTVAAPAFTPVDAVSVKSISSPDLSPDGELIAYELRSADLERSRYDSDIWIVPQAGGTAIPFAATPASERNPLWSPDGKTLAFLSDRGDRTQVWLIPRDGGEAWSLTSSPESVSDFEWSPSGDSIAYLAVDSPSKQDLERRERKDDARVLGVVQGQHLHLIDLESGEDRQVTSGDFSVIEIDFDPDGESIVLSRSPRRGLDGWFDTDLYRLSLETGAMEPIVERGGMDALPQVSPDGKWIAFLTHEGELHWNRQFRLAVVPAQGGTPRSVSEEYSRTPGDYHWSADSRSLIFQGSENTTAQIYRVGVDGGGFTRLTDVEGVIHDLGLGRSGEMVFGYESLEAPVELHSLSIASPRHAPRRLTSHNAEFLDRQLGKTRLVRWKNPKDELEIEGLLTLPLGYENGERVPLITFVHGGPASHFDQRFVGYLGTIYPVHAFAARGFAVLRPNPRGTGSYPESFRQANQADWGGMDYLDIQAGIDMLIEKGIADPDRLGMMGWSYGGFMTASTITQTDRFVAVSIGAPVVDLLSFHGTTDIPGFIPGYFDSTPWSNPDLYRKHSPMWNIASAKTPALIQHGENDDRVPLSQGLMLYRALEELDVPTVMVIYPRTPHTPREPLLQIDSANRNLWWFEKWLMDRDVSFEDWLRLPANR